MRAFNSDDEGTETVEHFGDLDSGIESNGDGGQETKTGRDSEGGRPWKAGKDLEEQRRVVRDQGRDHPHPRRPRDHARVRKGQTGKEAEGMAVDSPGVRRRRRALRTPRAAGRTSDRSQSELVLKNLWRQK